MRILCVDSNENLLAGLMVMLRGLGHEVHPARDLEEMLSWLALGGTETLFLNLDHDRERAADLLPRLRDEHPGLPVIVHSGEGDPATIVECVKRGATNFLTQPLSRGEIRLALSAVDPDAGEPSDSSRVSGRLSTTASPARTPASGIIAESPGMKQALTWGGVVANSADMPCMIQGESGVGKDVLARHIHKSGPRASGPMVVVNCSALPDHLIESELFGHRKGSFTGANRDHIGLIERASGGTLFLDEIGDMALAAQAKLLRVLEAGMIRPVGQTEEVAVNVRLIAATHRNLQEMIKAGQFRADLYYRLSVLRIVVPALRERREDLEPLFRLFVEDARVALGRLRLELSPEALEVMSAYDWPGNVRELRNVAHAVALFCRGREIRPEDLPASVRDAVPGTGPEAEGAAHADAPDKSDAPETLREAEWKRILRTYREANGNKSGAARSLGISRQTLSRRLAERGVK